MERRMTGKVLIVCTRRYNGEEMWTLLGELDRRDHAFEVVSQDTTIIVERTRKANYIDRLITDVDSSEVPQLKALVTLSGHPDDTKALWEDRHLHTLLRTAREAKVPLSSICMGVPALAPALRGVKVSAFPIIRAKLRLRAAGALIQNVALTVDVKHRVVTAENRFYTLHWAEELCNMIEGKPPQYQLVESGFDPAGLERLMDPVVREAIDKDRGYKLVLSKPHKMRKPQKGS